MVRRREPPQDLAELDSVVKAQEEGRVVQILNMDGVSPLGFGIRIAGPDSDRVQKARDAMQQERLERESLEPMSNSERYEEGTRFLARISISFEGRAVLDKRELQSTEDDFYKLYSRFRFVRQQIDLVAASRADFLPQSETTSSEQSGMQSQVGE